MFFLKWFYLLRTLILFIINQFHNCIFFFNNLINVFNIKYNCFHRISYYCKRFLYYFTMMNLNWMVISFLLLFRRSINMWQTLQINCFFSLLLLNVIFFIVFCSSIKISEKIRYYWIKSSGITTSAFYGKWTGSSKPGLSQYAVRIYIWTVFFFGSDS